MRNSSRKCRARNPSQCQDSRCPDKAAIGLLSMKDSLSSSAPRTVVKASSNAARSRSKGASGLLSEYVCALSLYEDLTSHGFKCQNNQGEIQQRLEEAIPRVAHQLDKGRMDRAYQQGHELSSHISYALRKDPKLLGFDYLSPSDVQSALIEISAVGNMTGSGSSEDITITLIRDGKTDLVIPISLKAYRSETTSMGSKAGDGSLMRMFSIQEGTPEKEAFDTHLKDYKTFAKEYYDSPAGKALIKKYCEDRGVTVMNNRLRRKELGDAYETARGYKSESAFAEHYANVFNTQLC